MAIIAKTRTIKVPDEVWERWQAEAKAAGCSTTALIIDRTEHAEDARAALVQQEAEICRLTDLLAARDLLIANVLHQRIEELEASLARVERPTLRPTKRS